MINDNFLEILDPNELSIIIEKMIELSRKENLYLKNMDIENLSKLAEEKLVLVFLITKVKNILQSNYIIREKFPEEEKNKLGKKYKILEELMTENLNLAGYATSFNRKILELLEQKFSKKERRLNIYNNRGGTIK